MNTTITLNNGYKMPIFGLGTFLSPQNECEEAVEHAIRCGYRLIDTAVAYNNQKAVGRAIKKCIEEGIVKREDLFITTKLWIADWKRENVQKTVTACLKDLQLEYIDLMLVHQGCFFQLPTEEDEKRQKGNFLEYTYFVPDNPKYRLGYKKEYLMETWQALEAAVDEGIVHSIGISNFTTRKTEDLLSFCRIKPVINQVELHPILQQWELKEFSEKNGISMMAYFPLGGAVTMGSDDCLLTNTTIKRIAENHHKTPAQVLIRWCIQRGVVCIPKSVHANRIEENCQVFDFELTEEEIQIIRKMDHHHRFATPGIFYASPLTWKDYYDHENIE